MVAVIDELTKLRIYEVLLARIRPCHSSVRQFVNS